MVMCVGTPAYFPQQTDFAPHFSGIIYFSKTGRFQFQTPIFGYFPVERNIDRDLPIQRVAIFH